MIDGRREGGPDVDVECPALRMHFARAEGEFKRGVEQRCTCDKRVVLAVLAAWIDAERLELAHSIQRDRPSEPAVIEMRGAGGHNDRGASAADEFLDERSRRFTPERKDGRQAMGGTDAFVPRAMRIAHDVAEDDVCDAERR